MALIPNPITQRFTASGAIGSGNKPIKVFNVNLVSTATASTCSIKDNGSGGTIYDQIDGLSSKSVSKNYAGGLRLPTNGYFTADGSISLATIIYSEDA